MSMLESLLNNALYVSILFILFSSLVAFYARSRARDRCLRDFDGYMVAVEDRQGKVAWGALRVYSSGIELLYASPHQDKQGHVENSYILYEPELVKLRALYRIHDDQSLEGQQARKRDIERTYQPSLLMRAARILRNLVSTFKDAIVQTANTVLAYRAQQNPQSHVLARHKELTSSSEQLWTSTVGNAYEPILERYIGQYVVLEGIEDSCVEEHGILKEYSAKYIELLNVKLEVPLQVYAKGRDPGALLHVDQLADRLRVSHGLERTVVVEAIHCAEASREIGAAVEPGQVVEIPLREGEAGQEVRACFAVRCLADLIVPRALAVVRHTGQRGVMSLKVFLGLDELSWTPWMKRLLGAPSKEHAAEDECVSGDDPQRIFDKLLKRE